MLSRRMLSLLCLVAMLSAGGAATPAHAQGGGGLGLFGGGGAGLGGRMIWSDEVIYDGYRIQKHSLVGHYRLIDPNDVRIVRGSYELCQQKLDELKVSEKLPPLPKDVVIVLHGLGAYRHFMNGISTYLEQQGGFYVINFGYPSTMLEIKDYAQSLDSVIRHLDGVENISFVAHSMGNIVVRKYLKDLEGLTPEMRPKVTFKRMVMISPPNHGAEIADSLGENETMAKLADMFAGPAAKALAPQQGWPELEKQLVTPNFEFGIIAGGRGDDTGYLAAIPGDDDSLLSVQTMKLIGATDFIQTRGLHQLMPNYEEVRAATLNYLKNGYFVAENAKRPIVAAATTR